MAWRFDNTYFIPFQEVESGAPLKHYEECVQRSGWNLITYDMYTV